jgi:Fanconi anemia group M protein
MLHNIFEQLKKRKNKAKKLPLIIADIHEKDSMILAELKSNKDINLSIKSLKIGDYLIGKTIIERKTISDFTSSMINKRLIQQLSQMKKYPSKILIIEGKQKNLYQLKNANSIRGFILSIITNYETNIIFTKDYQDTSQYLITLAKQQSKPVTKISFHSRIPKTKSEQKSYVLESFPNIGPKKAEILLKKFKTLNNVFNASEEDLKDILKKNSSNFRAILDS